MTSVEIANLALAVMGEIPIMAFTDKTPTASVLNTIYVPTVKYCLSIHNWNFALTQTLLPKLATNINMNYAYAYQEPADVLKIEKVRNNNNESIEYVESKTVIYTNSESVVLTYIHYYDSIESVFPPYFVNVIEYKLASELAIPVKNDLSFYKAYLEMFNAALEIARGIDSQRDKVKFVDNTKWLKGLL